MQEPSHQVPENEMSKRPGSGVWNGRAHVHQPVPAQLGHVLQGCPVRSSRKLHSAERRQLPRRVRQYRRRRTGVRKRRECLQVRIFLQKYANIIKTVIVIDNHLISIQQTLAMFLGIIVLLIVISIAANYH